MRLGSIALCLFVSLPALGRPLTVLIDPGHGGSNVGAPSRHPGLYEKQITLAIARALKQQLSLAGHRALLSRDEDRFLTVRQRSRQAKQLGADLFLSIHANASVAHDKHGVETYVLDHQTAELDEHRASAAVTGAEVLFTGLRTLDVRQRSIALGRVVQAALARERAAEDNRGVREGGYDVLAGLEVPAVLVEVGFLDHPAEGARLLQASEQQRIAYALAQAIDQFAKSEPAPFAILRRENGGER